MPVLPLVMSDAGLQPQAPADIRQQILDKVATTNEDYTANLPGGLVEDVLSTEVAAVVESDSFLVDLVNSITPNGANPFLLSLLGQLHDVPPAVATNTSVYLLFFGPPGFVIVQGFTVGDGAFQYVCQEGGIIGTDGQSLPIYAVSPLTGNWAVPAGTVNQLVTSVPASILNAGFSVTNPEDGIPATQGEAISDYRDRVQTAELASSTGMSRYMKTLVARVPGVQQRLVSARQDLASGRYIALVGAGDPYQVAYALSQAMFWVLGFTAPNIEITDIAPSTWTNPADNSVNQISVITTADNHNLLTGMKETISEVVGTGQLSAINNDPINPYTVTVVDEKTFWILFDCSNTSISSYISGGLVTPNPIVEQVTITDWPDTYLITYVIPAQEEVAMNVTWKTDSPNYVSQAAIASATATPLANYINSLAVGVTPINIYDMTQIFLDETVNIVPNENITFLDFEVFINGQAAAPGIETVSGKPLGVIYGDPNSYFFAQISDIVVVEAAE
jgi:hypothetical protein